MAGPDSGRMGFPGMRSGRLPADFRKMIEERGGLPGGGFPGDGQRGTGEQNGAQGGGQNGAGQMPGGLGGRQGGGFDRGGEVSSQMISYLEKHRDGATWLLAVSNSQSAASIILQTGKPVISMFGFGGSDRAMTAAKFQQLVKAGKLHYVMTGGGRFGGGDPGSPDAGSSEVTSWVTKNCTAVKVSEYGGSSSTGQNSGSSLYRCG